VRHVRMLGLCLVAAFALAAVAASSAVAGPQWVKCELAGPGHNYTGPNCTKAEKAKPKGTGEYELYKAPEVEAKRVAEGKSASVPFTGGNVGSGGVLTARFYTCFGGTYSFQRATRQGCHEGGGTGPHAAVYPKIECVAESSSGDAVSKNQVANVHVVFTGCKFSSLPCENTATAGEIVVNPLKGKLGWINKSEKKVGVLLEPEAGKHALFVSFECAGVVFTDVGAGNKKEGAFYVQGTNYPEGCAGTCELATPTEEKHGGYDGIISPITPVNEMTSEFEQVYTENGDKEVPQNIPNRFEGKHIDVLEAAMELYEEEEESEEFYLWSPAAEEITNVVEPEEAAEIKA
jgi:hypothetical protein